MESNGQRFVCGVDVKLKGECRVISIEVYLHRRSRVLQPARGVREISGKKQAAIGNDVRGVKKFVVPESTERTLVPIGIENPFPKGSLVQSLPHGRCYVLTPARFLLVAYR